MHNELNWLRLQPHLRLHPRLRLRLRLRLNLRLKLKLNQCSSLQVPSLVHLRVHV